MELRQLEYFIAIAETGAFSRAAMRLSVGQPVLSRQMEALEQELGTELYHRTGRGIVLSEAGKIFKQHARGVLETAAGARRAITALGNAPAGRVVIRMPPSVGAGRIRKWSIVEPTMTRSLVVATSTQRPVTKAARALVGFVRKQVDALVEEGRWAPRR